MVTAAQVAAAASNGIPDTGGAFGFYVKASILGGPRHEGDHERAGAIGRPARDGRRPTGDGQRAPAGEAQFEPAVIFKSGPPNVTAQRKSDAA